MRSPLKTSLLAASLLMSADSFAQPASPAPTVAPAKPAFANPGMNVYRRFDAKLTGEMVKFYDQALGLKPLQPIQLNASQQMILFGVGHQQVKLAAGLKEGRQYQPGKGVNEAVGIRLYALQFADEAALVARFKAAGYAAPAFREMGGGKRGALVRDPAGFHIQLVVTPDPAPGVEVGINVSDIARSRAFYREFVGLEELPPVEDGLLGVTKYPYRNGETVLTLWQAGKNLPADTGSAGIQYVISNVDAVNARALAQKVAVEEPLGGLPNFAIRFVWLNDADGVTNYFAQQGVRQSASAN